MPATVPRLDVPPAPDPDRGAPDAPAPALPRVSLLLRIVHKLVAYGTQLIRTLEQPGPTERQTLVMVDFGTRDLALIIARIKCGLLRAAGLEARLNRYVARGHDLTVPPVRYATASVGERKAASEATVRRVEALLPSAEEIAEQVRTRSLSTVIADICHDLGMTRAGLDGVLWDELMQAVLDCGITLFGIMRKSVKPVFGDWHAAREIGLSEWPPYAVVVASGQPP
jgi:hypothetical protein